jgi:phage/plasmid-like protein (TIGR03299 family)
MAHELTQQANKYEFAFLKSDGTAWHGHGQGMEDTDGEEAWTEQSGMGFTIRRSKVRYATSVGEAVAGQFVEMPEQIVLFRSDNKKALGVVSDKYKVVQPADIFKFFFGVAEVEGLTMSAAGTLFGGRRMWATAKIGEGSPISKQDKIGAYLLLCTSADGTLATEARVTMIRAVCQNTLQAARSEGKANVRLSHKTKFDASDVHKKLGTLRVKDTWNHFQGQMAQLAETPLTLSGGQDFVLKLLAGGAQQVAEMKGPEADKIRESLGYKRIMELFGGEQKGFELPGVKGTAYGMLQACTEYADHFQRTTSAENRFASAQWGAGADLKNDAFQTLLTMAR